MLEFFHKYQRSIVVYIFVGIIFASMLLFGIDLAGPQGTRSAIKVNEAEFSYRDVAEKRRQVEAQLRSQFGDSYATLLESFGANINEQVVDQLVDDELIIQTALKQNLAVDTSEVQKVIAGMFQNDFSAENYRRYLAQLGLSAKEFENQLKRESLRSQFLGVVSDFSAGSDYEALKLGQAQERTFNLAYIAIDPQKLKSEVSDLSQEELKDYYDSEALDYEVPEKVAYQAVLIKPVDVLELVEVYDEDIEAYFADHQEEFKLPARVKVSHIQINYGEDSSPDALNAVKEEAVEVHQKAMAGEDFSALVLKYSDDLPTKVLNGSLGWLSKGSRDDAVEKAALDLAAPGVADIVETNYGFHIVKVEEYQDSALKDLAEVKDEIEKKLRELDAPAYALVRAQELYEQWMESGNSLNDFASENDLKIYKSEGLLEEQENIDADLEGVTAKVLEIADQEKQLIESGKNVVLAEVVEHKEAFIPEFEQIKDQVIKDLTSKRAMSLAEEKALELVAKASSEGSDKDLLELATDAGFEFEAIKDFSAASSATGPLKDRKLFQKVLRSQKQGLLTREPLILDDKVYLLTIQKIMTPSASDLKRSLADYRREAKSDSLTEIRETIVQQAKFSADLYIDPALVASEQG